MFILCYAWKNFLVQVTFIPIVKSNFFVGPYQVSALPAELVEEDGGERREEEGADAGAADRDAGGEGAPLNINEYDN